MTDKLIEAVARSVERDLGASFLSHSTYRDIARAALAAIEASGDVTFVGDMDVKDWLRDAANNPELRIYAFAMNCAADDIERLRVQLAACPKVQT